MIKIKALFFAANPDYTGPLKLDEEIRAITEKIRAAEYRDSLELRSAWAVRPDDLLQLLNEYKPQIVHFSGHGTANGIVLKDRNGQPQVVSTQALKALFTTLKGNIQLVLLSSCYSRLQAQAIVEAIDCVIGMNTVVEDETTTIFAASFYRALGFGDSIQGAFDQGKVALLLEGDPGENIPELLIKPGVDATKKFLIAKPASDREIHPSAINSTNNAATAPPAFPVAPTQVGAKEVFLCYAPEDRDLMHKLRSQLHILQLQGHINIHDNQDIVAGLDRQAEIDKRIQQAAIILLLVSPSFITSSDCYAQMKQALKRRGQAKVIPILLKAIDLEGTPLEKIQGFPRNRKPIANLSSAEQDMILAEITREIRQLVK